MCDVPSEPVIDSADPVLLSDERLAELRAITTAGEYQPSEITALFSHIDALLLRAQTAECFTVAHPCVEAYEAPYDFKYCNTHDRTFALDAHCDHAGKSVIDHLDDEITTQRVRAMRAEDKLHELLPPAN